MIDPQADAGLEARVVWRETFEQVPDVNGQTQLLLEPIGPAPTRADAEAAAAAEAARALSTLERKV